MFEYTFCKEPLKLGEFDETYGQTYWCEVNEHLQPVKFNSKNQTISMKDKITAQERAEKRTAKGKDYYQLKKVEVVGTSTAQPAPSAPVSDSELKTQLDRIEGKLDKLLGIDESLVSGVEPKKAVNNEPLPDEPPDYGDEEY